MGAHGAVMLLAITVFAAPAHAHLEQGGEEAIDRKAAPFRQEHHEHEQEVRLRDILGGLGYIVGITGIAPYFLGRRKRRE